MTTDSHFPPERRAEAKRRREAAAAGDWKAGDWVGTNSPHYAELIGPTTTHGAICMRRTDAEEAAGCHNDLPDALAELDRQDAVIGRLEARIAELEAG